MPVDEDEPGFWDDEPKFYTTSEATALFGYELTSSFSGLASRHGLKSTGERVIGPNGGNEVKWDGPKVRELYDSIHLRPAHRKPRKRRNREDGQ